MEKKTIVINIKRADFLAIRRLALAKTAARKSRRAENAAFIAAVNNKPAKKRRRKPSARRVALGHLKALRDQFVMLRAKSRTAGFCEVAMACDGRGRIEVVYHIFPAAMGNAIKHDARNLLGSCTSCNGSEYFARKRGDDCYQRRHLEILGPKLYAELKAAQGRRQISTAEAITMAEEYQRKIEAGEWKDSCAA